MVSAKAEIVDQVGRNCVCVTNGDVAVVCGAIAAAGGSHGSADDVGVLPIVANKEANLVTNVLVDTFKSLIGADVYRDGRGVGAGASNIWQRIILKQAYADRRKISGRNLIAGVRNSGEGIDNPRAHGGEVAVPHRLRDGSAELGLAALLSQALVRGCEECFVAAVVQLGDVDGTIEFGSELVEAQRPFG